jgi:uncharacterized protein YkwD
MRRITCVLWAILAYSSISPLEAQKIEFNWRWDEETVNKARTAEDADFLNEDEKKVILYTNLARANGSLFASTFLDEYVRIKKLTLSRYIQSLYDELKHVSDLPMLIPERDLYKAAREHASRSGKKGYEGHKGFKQRYSPMMKKYVEVGENIYYGPYTPLEIVMQLLVDEGIEDLGHRKNLLSPEFNSIGVAIKPHKTYEYNCVMSFGKLPRTYLDFVQ